MQFSFFHSRSYLDVRPKFRYYTWDGVTMSLTETLTMFPADRLPRPMYVEYTDKRTGERKMKKFSHAFSSACKGFWNAKYRDGADPKYVPAEKVERNAS